MEELCDLEELFPLEGGNKKTHHGNRLRETPQS